MKENKKMYLAAIISNRLIRLFATFIKISSFGIHGIFPRFRLIIPKQVKPFIKVRGGKIPKIIWQTNYTNKVSVPMYFNYLINRLMTLDHEYRFLDDRDQSEYVRTYSSKRFFETYNSLNVGAARADVWRYVALMNEGGVYIDIDACLVWPISWMTPGLTLFCEMNKEHFTNYFMAVVSKDPILSETLQLVEDNITSKNSPDSIYNMTGPIPLMKAMKGKDFDYRKHRYLCIQGAFANEFFQYLGSTFIKWTKVPPAKIFK